MFFIRKRLFEQNFSYTVSITKQISRTLSFNSYTRLQPEKQKGFIRFVYHDMASFCTTNKRLHYSPSFKHIDLDFKTKKKPTQIQTQYPSINQA